ncbi:MAG: beta-carotene 15,15'-monooxygenase, partial [Kaistella sp.]
MPEFDLDNFKKTWQEQEVQPKYNSTEIEAMLNKSSRNYVKYILWISIAEFLIILGMNFYYT